jgi:hypothetical protein
MDAKKYSPDTHHNARMVAKILGCTWQTAFNMLGDGRLKPIKASTRINVTTQQEVERYIKESAR